VPAFWLVVVATRPVRPAEGLGIDRPAAPAGGRGKITGDTWRRWSVIVLAVSAEFCFWTWGAARLTDAGAAADAASGLAGAFAIGMGIGRMIGPRSAGAMGPVALSALVTGVAASLVILDVSIAWLVIGLLLAGLGVAVLYPVSLARLLDAPGVSEERLIAMAAFASGTAITVTPTLLGFLDQLMEVRFAFALVPVLVAGVVWLDRQAGDR
jgi:MFS family permease